jgi:pimeloyl-ACP methyl ester carboxylesterase
VTQQVKVAGRTVAYETWGDERGTAIFLLHGTPGGLLGPRPRGLELRLMRTRLITYDRPGYGRSDRLIGRRVVDAATDVAAVADHLGIERFAVVGRSGGAPHALACAAALGDRVTAVASLVGVAPRDADGLDWTAGMCPSNRRQYTEVWRAYHGVDDGRPPAIPASAAGILSRNTDALVNPSTDFLQGRLRPDMDDADVDALTDPGIRRLVVDNFRQATTDEQLVPFGAGGQRVLAGWLDDNLAFCGPWGFPLDAVRQPALLWHGERDTFSPVGHSRWLAERLPDASLVVNPAAAHFGAVKVLPDVLLWLSQHTPRP